MKKTFACGLAVLSLSSTALAQTAVSLYGIADGGLRFDHTTIGTLRSVQSSGESGTRWGLRGAEDLGNGLKATFNFEQGFDLSDNSVTQGNVTGGTPSSPTSSSGGRLFSRTSTVGLSSLSFGEVRIGHAYTPHYVLWTSIDPMSGGFIGGAQNYAVGSTTRFDNAVYFDSPKLYGFQLSGAARAGEATVADATAGSQKNGGNAGNLLISYAVGPVLAGYSYLSTKNAADNNNTRSQFAGAVYDMGVAKLHALLFKTRSNTTRLRSFGLGATVPLGAWTLLGQVGRVDNQFNTGGSTLKNDDALFIGLNTTYAFSKRTDVYLGWAKQKNKNNALFVLTDSNNAGLFTTTGATANVRPGFDPWSAQVGLRHRF